MCLGSMIDLITNGLKIWLNQMQNGWKGASSAGVHLTVKPVDSISLDTTYSRGTGYLGLEAEIVAEKSKKEDQGPHQCTGAFDTALSLLQMCPTEVLVLH